MKYIKFIEEKQKYKVMIENEQFMICTKPFNAKKTFLYTIVDKKNHIRGADEYWKWGGRYKYDDIEECKVAINLLTDDNCILSWSYIDEESGEIVTDVPYHISGRNQIPLDIEWIDENGKKTYYKKGE